MNKWDVINILFCYVFVTSLFEFNVDDYFSSILGGNLGGFWKGKEGRGRIFKIYRTNNGIVVRDKWR